MSLKNTDTIGRRKSTNNMEYTEEKAREIVEKYNLSPTTMKVWRTRGEIPDKYNNPEYTPTEKASKADNVIIARLAELNSRGYINFSVLCDVAKVNKQIIYDAMRMKGRVNRNDLDKIVLELKKLRVFIKNNLVNSPAKLKALFDNKILKFYVINGKDEWAKSMYWAMSNENDIAAADFSKLQDNYVRVYLAITV